MKKRKRKSSRQQAKKNINMHTGNLGHPGSIKSETFFFNIFHIRLLETFSGYHHAEHTGCVNSNECLEENGTSHDCSETQNCVDNIGEFYRGLFS